MARKIVYRHRTLSTGEVFYIGIGSVKRSKAKSGRSIFWSNITNKNGYSIEIIADKLTWEDACELEHLLIEEYGRRDLGTGRLVNMTNGGEGSLGTIVSIETRKKLRLANIGKILSEEYKIKIGLGNKGKGPTKFVRKKQKEKISKKVIDSSTGEIYVSAKEAHTYSKLNYLAFTRRLNGTIINKTTFKYY